MLLNPIYHFMRNGEYVEYAQSILDILRAYADKHDIIQKQIDELEQTLDTHQYAMVGKTKNSYTEPLRVADKERESAFVALRDYVKACNRRLFAEWKKPSTALMTVFRTYGWDLYTRDYNKQTHMLDLLLNELNDSGENLEALAQINALDWYVELKAANEYFKELIDDRVGEEQQKPQVKTSTTRLQVRNACKKACEILTDDNFADEPTRNNVLNQLNEAAKSINKVVKNRMDENKKRKGRK